MLRTHIWIVGALMLSVVMSERGVLGANIYAVHYPPYMIENETKPGFAIEVILEASRRVGDESSLSFLPFPRMVDTLLHDKKGMFPTFYRNLQRENKFLWLAKVWTIEQGFLSIHEPVNSLEEARKLRKVGVEQKTSLHQFLVAQKFHNLEIVSSPQQNAKKLAAGRIDAWFLTIFLAQQIWNNEHMSSPLVIGKPVLSENSFIVANRAFPPRLARKYTAAISLMQQDGTIRSIVQKYSLDLDTTMKITFP